MNPHIPGMVPMMVPQPYMMAMRLPSGMQPPSGQPGQHLVQGMQGVQGVQGLHGMPMSAGQLSGSPSPQVAGASQSSSTPGAGHSATPPATSTPGQIAGSALAGGVMSSSAYGGMPISGASLSGLAGTPIGAGHVPGAQYAGLPGVQMAGIAGSQMAGMAGGLSAQQVAGMGGAQLAGLSAQHMVGLAGAQIPGYSGSALQGAAMGGAQMTLAQAMSAHQQPPSPPPSLASGGSDRKRTAEAADLNSADMWNYPYGYVDQQQQQQQQQALQGAEAADASLDDTVVVLDDYNSDLHLMIDQDGYGAKPMNKPPGFCFCWAGARASHGVCRGKAYYEVKVTEELAVDFGEDHQETNPHILRVGWSMNFTSFQLGEEPDSYGYGGTGRFSVNSRFSSYGEKFQMGDVIGCLLDLEARPPNISYAKNGRWLGVAVALQGYAVGQKDKALFPHVLTKNTRFEVNFGQQAPWFPPAPGFLYTMQFPVADRVRGLKPPSSKSSCEMIMIIGLPGAGKTTWGINKVKDNPEVRYNIIGTDTLIDKMKVMGLPRKNNYHGRWDVLIDKASKCLNKLFEIASKKKRNLILDQTNVYPSARRRKMKNFKGFIRRAAVLVPDDPELLRRSDKRTYEDGKFVPEEAVLDMKANFKLPLENDENFDYVEYMELPREKALSLVEAYNKEGQMKRPHAVRGGGSFNKNDNRFKPPSDLRQETGNALNVTDELSQLRVQLQGSYQGTSRTQQSQMGSQGMSHFHGAPPLPPTSAPQPPPPPPPDHGHYGGMREGRMGRSEPQEKKGRFDSSGGGGTALDLLKQEYSGAGEVDQAQAQLWLQQQEQQQQQDQQQQQQQQQQQFQNVRVKAEPAWKGDFGDGQGPASQQNAAKTIQGQMGNPGQGILGAYSSQPPSLMAGAYSGQQQQYWEQDVKQESHHQSDRQRDQGQDSWQNESFRQDSRQNQWQGQGQGRSQGGQGYGERRSRGQGDFDSRQQNQRQSWQQSDSNKRDGQRDNFNRQDSGFMGQRGGRGDQYQQQEQNRGQSQYGSQPGSYQPKSKDFERGERDWNQPRYGGDQQRQEMGNRNNYDRSQNRRNDNYDRSQNSRNDNYDRSQNSRNDTSRNENQFQDYGQQGSQNEKPKRERRRPSKWDTPSDKPDVLESESQATEAEVQQDFQNALSNLRSKLANNPEIAQREASQAQDDDERQLQEQMNLRFSANGGEGKTQDTRTGSHDGDNVNRNFGSHGGDMGKSGGPENLDGPGFVGGPRGPGGPGPRNFGPRGPRDFGSGNFDRNGPPFGQQGGFRPRGGMDHPPQFRGRGSFPEGGRGGPNRPFRPRNDGDDGPRGPGGRGGGWNQGGPRGPFNPRGMGPRGPPPFMQRGMGGPGGPGGRFQRPMGQQRW